MEHWLIWMELAGALAHVDGAGALAHLDGALAHIIDGAEARSQR